MGDDRAVVEKAIELLRDGMWTTGSMGGMMYGPADRDPWDGSPLPAAGPRVTARRLRFHGCLAGALAEAIRMVQGEAINDTNVVTDAWGHPVLERLTDLLESRGFESIGGVPPAEKGWVRTYLVASWNDEVCTGGDQAIDLLKDLLAEMPV